MTGDNGNGRLRRHATRAAAGGSALVLLAGNAVQLYDAHVKADEHREERAALADADARKEAAYQSLLGTYRDCVASYVEYASGRPPRDASTASYGFPDSLDGSTEAGP